MQNMLIAILAYTKPLEEVDAILPKHRQYLQKLFDQKKLLVCGRLNPRTGGVIIAKNISREDFEKILKNDPFTKVSKHTIIEFTPSLYDGSINMSGHVFVVSEWLPKKNCEEELWKHFKSLMSTTLKNESGCIRAHATRQISHPGSPGKSKYKIVLLQEYIDVKAFDIHCSKKYVSKFFKKYVENEETSIVKEWTCRLFSEDG